MGCLCKVWGCLCPAFAVIDLAGMIFSYDSTGIFRSPVVAGVAGSIRIAVGEKISDDELFNGN
jgi:hypothetical protein